MSAAPLIWINALPGTGKHTIALQMWHQDKSTILISHHSIIYPVVSRMALQNSLPCTAPEYREGCHIERQNLLKQYVLDPSYRNMKIVFTDFQINNKGGVEVLHEFMDAAHEAGRPFVSVCLICRPDVLMQRVTSYDRKMSSIPRMIDADIVWTLVHTSLPFKSKGGMELDTTDLKPQEAAKKIAWFAHHKWCQYCDELEKDGLI